MVQYINNPPDASALMTSARSFGNYDLAAALADLIDNSIKARTHKVRLKCLFNDGEPEVRIIDDGQGMTAEELYQAMRPASTSPLEKRSPDDLGRFGWGMKSASFSQCSHLIVISNKKGKSAGATWDLNDLDDWKMGILTPSEIAQLASGELSDISGTEVIWKNCDRLSENGSIRQEEFDSLITHAGRRLSLIFHRYIGGLVRGKNLQILINGQDIEFYDPFHRKHDATQQLETETLQIGGKKITIQPFILPHYSKIRYTDHQILGGEEGFLKNQGFYVFRNHRLIMHGTWFRLVRHGELSQLVRISIDIPNDLDNMWKITVDKSDVQLPSALKTRLKQIVDRLRKKSSRVFRSKGGKIHQQGVVSIWGRYAKNGEIRYEINRDHPLISTMLEKAQEPLKTTIDCALRVIEQGLPVISFGQDASTHIDDIHQTETDPEVFRSLLKASLPTLLSEAQGDIEAMLQQLRKTEPYDSNWKMVQEFLVEERWINGET